MSKRNPNAPGRESVVRTLNAYRANITRTTNEIDRVMTQMVAAKQKAKRDELHLLVQKLERRRADMLARMSVHVEALKNLRPR